MRGRHRQSTSMASKTSQWLRHTIPDKNQPLATEGCTKSGAEKRTCIPKENERRNDGTTHELTTTPVVLEICRCFEEVFHPSNLRLMFVNVNIQQNSSKTFIQRSLHLFRSRKKSKIHTIFSVYATIIRLIYTT